MNTETWGPELDGESRQRERRGRTFTVRLALVDHPSSCDIAITYTDVPGQDADEAAAKAVKKAERECAVEGFVLDGPVEEES